MLTTTIYAEDGPRLTGMDRDAGDSSASRVMLAEVDRRQAAEASKVGGVSGTGRRIVIVDPVRTTLDLISYVLEQEGYQPFPFSRLEGAVQYLEHHSADLVVTETASPWEAEKFDLKPLLKAANGAPVIVYTRKPELVGSEEGVALVPRPSDIRVLLNRIAGLVAPGSGQPS